MISRRSLLPLLAMLLAPVFGVSTARADHPMIYASDGLAIKGYDVVAYFTDEKPVKGSPSHHVMWKGAIWWFASSRNQELFEGNPRAYAPKYGGYCAYAVSLGKTSATDPDAWAIHEGRLYLTRDKKVRSLWEQDVQGNVLRANMNWPAVLER